jgi:hypothetical protein
MSTRRIMTRRFVGFVIAAIMLVSTTNPARTAAQSGAVLVPAVSSPWPGKVFVNHDEWVLSNFGFAAAPNTGRFALNVASWFTGGRPGRFLVDSANFGLNEPALAATIRGAGHTWVTGTSVPFTLETLLQYDAVFLAHDTVDTSVLIDYVRAGGKVYLAGGTGPYHVTEAANWNPFLNAFGLGFEPSYNLRPNGVKQLTTTSPLFTGVTALYEQYGQPITKLDAIDRTALILVAQDGRGLFAAYETTVIPVAVELCESHLVLGSHETISVSIAGTADFDVRKVDPTSVRVVKVRANSNILTNYATPSPGRRLGKSAVAGCPTFSDSRLDLVLWFDSDDVLDSAATILGHDLKDGDMVALTLTGRLKAAYGGTPIVGESLVRVQEPSDGLIGNVLGIVGGLL